MKDIKSQMRSVRGRELFSYLPAYYEISRVMHADMDAKGSELDALYLALDETLAQFFVRTATWALERWEIELGIPIHLDKPLEQRRSVVESKLRGSGKFSGRLIKNVAEAYDGGAVNVTFQHTEWGFTVKFIDTIGVPPNLEDLKASIEEIKPTHLSVEYEFRYLLIRDIHEKKILREMEQTILSKFAGGVQ
ncbi:MULTISPECIES: YmfQ family protein [unclassified Paenibacillus]|uniref:YmfQ family protein n=1 Tax=unclassified Paenibacillus TaxID=185978 RepID=UPI00384CC447